MKKVPCLVQRRLRSVNVVASQHFIQRGKVIPGAARPATPLTKRKLLRHKSRVSVQFAHRINRKHLLFKKLQLPIDCASCRRPLYHFLNQIKKRYDQITHANSLHSPSIRCRTNAAHRRFRSMSTSPFRNKLLFSTGSMSVICLLDTSGTIGAAVRCTQTLGRRRGGTPRVLR